MSIHGVLGESTTYSKTYDPTILYPISRQIGRDEILKDVGFDFNNYHDELKMAWIFGKPLNCHG